MNRQTPSKRARSPSAHLDVSEAQVRKRDNPVANDGDLPSDSPKLPMFLHQTPGRMQDRFEKITWLERARINQGLTNPEEFPECVRYDGPGTGVRALDRYSNIFPWDYNRIHLQVPPGHNDYINASSIMLRSASTGMKNRYIAMQGPKQDSTSHVWRMVWEQLESPAVIVMLTETHDGNQEKCFKYFPSLSSEPMVINAEDEVGDGFQGTVECEEESLEVSGTVVRKLRMRVNGEAEEKVIWHLLYTAWPDFGVPSGKDLDSFFALMELSKTKNVKSDNPRIIHCSAGVGRSGTFIALEHLMGEMEASALEYTDDRKHDPVFETVNALRSQRVSMVQACPQYLFIYQVLLSQWKKKHSVVGNSSEHVSKMAKLDLDDDSGSDEGDVFL